MWRLFWWRPPCLLRRVIVNLKQNDAESFAIRGLLWSARGLWLTVRQAELLSPSHEPKLLDGEIHIHRSEVAFIQVLP